MAEHTDLRQIMGVGENISFFILWKVLTLFTISKDYPFK